MDKAKKKELLKQFKRNEKDLILKSLPITIDQINALFDYLDAELGNQECDNTHKLTKNFLVENNLPEKETILWLDAQGGCCDCEVLFNVEEKIDDK